MAVMLLCGMAHFLTFVLRSLRCRMQCLAFSGTILVKLFAYLCNIESTITFRQVVDV